MTNEINQTFWKKGKVVNFTSAKSWDKNHVYFVGKWLGMRNIQVKYKIPTIISKNMYKFSIFPTNSKLGMA